jgi:alpha-mannosidase
MQFHLIANAHLDPVWLWDWREGYNEAITTIRTVLDLMDENNKLTFIRGESALYRHIEETDPETFARIAAYVKSGRWDIVGGTYVQPDTNLAGTECLARHFTEGQRYFEDRFQRKVTVAWQADSFGHAAGLPEVLNAAGIDSFAFTRPDKKVFPLSSPAFWWEGASGARVLAYRPMIGWYGTERDEIPRRLDGLLDAAHKSSLLNVACFYGVGNHGGGPTRRQLLEIRAWAETHPDVKVIHSGLHPFFAALREEIKGRAASSIPVHRGELNFCLRGCYSTMAKFKRLYRQGENLLARAEKTDSVIAGHLGLAGADLTEAWKGILFNSFHDILPGSSIERAFDDQTAWMGEVLHTSQKAELRALNRLAMQVDTVVSERPEHHPSAVAALVWNPHPQPYRGHIELEACLDYRPIWAYDNRPTEIPLRVLGPSGTPLPFQEIETENRSMVHVPWRKRVLVPVSLPSFGWNVLEMGWVEGATVPKVKNAVTSSPNWIDNENYRVKAVRGKKGITISYKGKALFAGDGLTADVLNDPWGSWGGMLEEPDSIRLTDKRETWEITEVELLESGPERAKLWVRLAGKKSRIDLSFSVSRGRPAVDVEARVFWAERSARLKLRFPVGDEAEFEVPGATVTRKPCGEVPGGKWVAVDSKFGFASDALYNFDTENGVLSATVIRGTRYADDVPTPADTLPWLPATDLGEFKFRFLMTAEPKGLPDLARELEQPPLAILVPSRKGTLPRQGSLASLQPASLQLLALKRAETGRGFVLRVQGSPGKTVQAKLDWMGSSINLGPVRNGQIVSWLLEPTESTWKTTVVDLSENPKETPSEEKKSRR